MDSNRLSVDIGPDKGKVSVIIPTFNAGYRIGELIASILKQEHKPDEILVIDSTSSDETEDVVKTFEEVELIVIPQVEFNHGLTRDYAFRHTHGDYVFFLTQDAKIANNNYIDVMLDPFSDPKVGMVTGRQIAQSEAKKAEKLIREYNYPSESCIRSYKDVGRLGIKTFFASDVCSVYRRTAYYAVGGFEKVSTNEDMFIAAKFINNGFLVAYQAKAEVIHSHTFTFKQQFRRNYLSAYEIEMHRELLGDVSLNNEGIHLVKYVISKLLAARNYASIFVFCFDCAARLFGNKAGTLVARRKKNGN